MEEPVVPGPTLIIRLSSVQFSDLSLCLGARVLHYFKDKTKNIYHSAHQTEVCTVFTKFSPQLVQLENICSAVPPLLPPPAPQPSLYSYLNRSPL